MKFLCVSWFCYPLLPSSHHLLFTGFHWKGIGSSISHSTGISLSFHFSLVHWTMAVLKPSPFVGLACEHLAVEGSYHTTAELAMKSCTCDIVCEWCEVETCNLYEKETPELGSEQIFQVRVQNRGLGVKSAFSPLGNQPHTLDGYIIRLLQSLWHISIPLLTALFLLTVSPCLGHLVTLSVVAAFPFPVLVVCWLGMLSFASLTKR